MTRRSRLHIPRAPDVRLFASTGFDERVLIVLFLIAFKTLPTLEYDLLTEDGRPGWIGEWFAHENDDSMVPVGKPVKEQYIDETRMFIRYEVQFKEISFY